MTFGVLSPCGPEGGWVGFTVKDKIVNTTVLFPMVSFCSLWFRLEGFHSFVWRASLYFCLEGFPFVWRVFLLGMAKMRQNHASRHEYVHYPHHSAFTASAWPCPSLFPAVLFGELPHSWCITPSGSCDAADLGGDKLLAL